jgi:hypothetical protein
MNKSFGIISEPIVLVKRSTLFKNTWNKNEYKVKKENRKIVVKYDIKILKQINSKHYESLYNFANDKYTYYLCKINTIDIIHNMIQLSNAQYSRSLSYNKLFNMGNFNDNFLNLIRFVNYKKFGEIMIIPQHIQFYSGQKNTIPINYNDLKIPIINAPKFFGNLSTAMVYLGPDSILAEYTPTTNLILMNLMDKKNIDFVIDQIYQKSKSKSKLEKYQYDYYFPYNTDYNFRRTKEYYFNILKIAIGYDCTFKEQMTKIHNINPEKPEINVIDNITNTGEFNTNHINMGYHTYGIRKNDLNRYSEMHYDRELVLILQLFTNFDGYFGDKIPVIHKQIREFHSEICIFNPVLKLKRTHNLVDHANINKKTGIFNEEETIMLKKLIPLEFSTTTTKTTTTTTNTNQNGGGLNNLESERTQSGYNNQYSILNKSLSLNHQSKTNIVEININNASKSYSSSSSISYKNNLFVDISTSILNTNHKIEYEQLRNYCINSYDFVKKVLKQYNFKNMEELFIFINNKYVPRHNSNYS